MSPCTPSCDFGYCDVADSVKRRKVYLLLSRSVSLANFADLLFCQLRPSVPLAIVGHIWPALVPPLSCPVIAVVLWSTLKQMVGIYTSLIVAFVQNPKSCVTPIVQKECDTTCKTNNILPTSSHYRILRASIQAALAPWPALIWLAHIGQRPKVRCFCGANIGYWFKIQYGYIVLLFRALAKWWVLQLSTTAPAPILVQGA